MKNYLDIAPSILEADFWNLQSQISLLENYVSKLHIDVMDGHFVPNISMGIPILKSIRKHTNLILDVHLMISNPEKYINNFLDAGSDILTFHIETTTNPLALIQQVKQKNKLVGVAISPNTPPESILNIINYIDSITIMGVEPGFGGQKFIPNTLNKIKFLSKYGKPIEVDGGINENNILEIADNGANIFVAGNAIFNKKNIIEAIQNLSSGGGGNFENNHR